MVWSLLAKIAVSKFLNNYIVVETSDVCQWHNGVYLPYNNQVRTFFDYITQKRRKYSPKVLLTDASDSQDLYRHDNLPFSFILVVKSFHQ